LRFYRDLNESTNVDLGGSFARGRSYLGDGWNQIYGADATLRWKPLRRSIYHSFVGRSELVWSRTLLNPLQTGPFLRRPIITPFGFYVSGDSQLGRRWMIGARFDRSQRGPCVPTNPVTISTCNGDFSLAPTQLLQDTGGSLLLTYQPSEFSQIR